MTKSEKKAYEFEALICRTQALAIEVKGMLADNEWRQLRQESPAWDGDDFRAKADRMRNYADEFIKLRDLETNAQKPSEQQEHETYEATEMTMDEIIKVSLVCIVLKSTFARHVLMVREKNAILPVVLWCGTGPRICRLRWNYMRL